MYATLSVRSLSKSFHYSERMRIILDNVSTIFEQNKTYAITGASGAGKSTLLYLLAGLEMPSTGNVYYNDHDIWCYTPEQKSIWLNQKIGSVFQYPYLIKELSVIENVLLPALLYQSKSRALIERARHLLHAVGLAHTAEYAPPILSGGEQQRVAIARALINNPEFILADEPTGNLDPTTSKIIVELLLQCQRESGAGLIVSSHDKYVAESMQFIYHMRDGSLYLQSELAFCITYDIP